MMSKVFISYADANMAYSLKRIGRQARKLGFFDKVILYTPDLLPAYIKASALMQHTKGGGYWAWKPAIIWETLQKYGDGTIVVYADAGCSLYPSNDWNTYDHFLQRFDTVCFEYKDVMPEWEVFGQTSTKIKYWTKKATLDYFKGLLNDDFYGERFNKIWGGFLLCKGKDNAFIQHWLKITLARPMLVMDPSENENLEGNRELAYHKHDQSIITPLAHYYSDKVKVLVEKSETEKIAAVIGSRVRAKNFKAYFILMAKLTLRRILGDGTFNGLKRRFK